MVGFTTGSRAKVPGKTCEKRIRNNNNNNNNSIQFLISVCCINNQMANYRCSTKE
jgi:hypothetical protein